MRNSFFSRFFLLFFSITFLKVSLSAKEASAKWTLSESSWHRGSGNFVTESREIKGVHGICLESPGAVHLEIGDKESLVVTADDNLLPFIKTDVDDGVLSLKFESGLVVVPSKSIVYHIVLKKINDFEITRIGSITCNSDIYSETMQIVMGGGGTIKLGKLIADRCKMTIRGPGNINIDGVEVIKLFSININGSGSLVAKDIMAGRFQAEIRGNGSIKCNDIEIDRAILLLLVGSACVECKSLMAETADFETRGGVIFSENNSINRKITISAERGGVCNLLRIVTKKIELNISKDSSVIFEGKTIDFDVKIDENGVCEALELKSDQTYVSISESGRARVWAQEKLVVESTADGIIEYRGDPRLLETTGKIKKV